MVLLTCLWVSGSRLHYCAACNKAYKRRTHLLRHTKYECGKAPSFHCEQCDYRCYRKDIFHQHLLTRKHLKWFNYVCTSRWLYLVFCKLCFLKFLFFSSHFFLFFHIFFLFFYNSFFLFIHFFSNVTFIIITFFRHAPFIRNLPLPQVQENVQTRRKFEQAREVRVRKKGGNPVPFVPI